METLKQSRSEHRGFALAVLMLTIGVIWLLYNIQLIPTSGVGIALSLWPLALIAIGADLLMRKQSPQISAFIVLAIALFVVLAALLAPRLGIGVLKTSTDSYAEELNNAESARILVNPSVGLVNIHALESDNLLFTAEATHIGELNFDVHGTNQRTIEFGQNEVSTTNWFGTDEDLQWTIGLSPTIPLDLTVNTGVGESYLDFTDLNLSNLLLTIGVGRVDLTLPTQENAYQVVATGGVGNLDITVPGDTSIDLTVNSGVGEVRIDLPEDVAVRIRISSGLGSVRMPSWMEQINSGGDEQIWQSSNYVGADHQVNIHVQSGLGGLTIR